MRKNIENNYIIEIETKSEKISLMAGEIDRVSSDPTSFTLVHKVKI